MNQFIVLSFLAVISICTGFYRHHVPTSSVLLRARRGAEVKVEAPKFVVGENLPIEVSKDQAIYDMILVERISAPERTSVGLFLPKVEGKDQKHLGKVISMPKEYGLESECGRVQPVEEILPFNLGDIVYIRDPWGIGPKDIEVAERCFSFHKAAQITGVVKKANGSS